MPETVLITGSSSGVGQATGLLFADRGWNVVATMRDPAAGPELSTRGNVLVAPLDVTDRASIAAAIGVGIARFGRIDVLVNNAGFAVIGVLEAIPFEAIVRQFAVNVFGPMATTQAILPHFRDRSRGLVINVSSIVGRFTYPLGSIYDASKFAVEGFSEALRFELDAIGVRVKVIEPGLIATDFGTRSMAFLNDETLAPYQPVVRAMGRMAARFAAEAEPATVAAEAVWAAANDPTDRLRYPAGAAALRGLDEWARLGDAAFYARTRERFGLQAAPPADPARRKEQRG
jgi:NAD(P)-dependent dehydrogenase (short-subunit alcohol dehydrogenase family)